MIKSKMTHGVSRRLGLWGCRVIVCLVCGSAIAADPNAVQDADNDLLLAERPRTVQERDLWSARFHLGDSPEETATRSELQDLLKRVGAIQFQSLPPLAVEPAVGPEPAIVPMPAPVVVEPNEPEAAAEPPLAVAPQAVPAAAPVPAEPPRPQGYISSQTLDVFKSMLDRPEQIKNPLQLAEILYRSDCLPEAAVCYQAALDRLDSSQEDPFEDRAWILFQLGNCFSKSDPLAALQSFNRVVKDYPHCLWVEMARAKSQLIDWQLKDKPSLLIHDNQISRLDEE